MKNKKDNIVIISADTILRNSEIELHTTFDNSGTTMASERQAFLEEVLCIQTDAQIKKEAIVEKDDLSSKIKANRTQESDFINNKNKQTI